ncbi:MAG: WD40 repeat domain-containing protein [Candidatus Lokiarchaeota archaeon]|nr:WD40 repeat domain-containing protein [Candidatus Lokiarchaeota archaeon]
MKSIKRVSIRRVFTYVIIFILFIGFQDNSKSWEKNNLVDPKVTNLRTSSEVGQIKPLWSRLSDESISDVAMSADGNYVAVGATNHIYLYTRQSSSPIINYSATYGGRHIAISSNGDYFTAANGGGGDGKLFFFHKSSSTPLWIFDILDSATSLSMSSDGKYIALASYDKKVRLFNRSSSTPLWTFSAPSGIDDVDISSDGSYISATGGSIANIPKVFLFGKSSSIPLWNYTIYDKIVSMAISSDGNYIVVGSSSLANKIYLFNKTGSTPMWTFTTGYPIMTVEISNDTNYIVAGIENGGGKVYFFNRSNPLPLWSYSTGTDAHLTTVAISSNGSYIIAGNEDYSGETEIRPGNVYFFQKSTSIPIWHYRTGRYVCAVSISSDGTYSAVGSRRGLYIFDNHRITNPSPIPGYNLYLLLGTTCIICVLYKKVRLKTIKKRK